MDNSCICQIRDIYKAIVRFEHELDRQFGLNINEGMLLCLLQDTKPMQAKDIADKMNLTKSNTSKVIASLEKRQYIERQGSDLDYRYRYFRITEEGLRILEQIHSDKVCIPEDLCRYISRP